ncbi:hypothetical protein FRC05_008745 [Tulasnella sp. 425]|nr:hypothetical protein FRC05_008745 [Tulasnella sp. 425]
MALPTTRDNPAPPSRNDVPASSLGGKVDDARNGVLSILKGTNWPRKARRDVQDLIQMVETKLNPDHIPTDDTQMPEDLRDAIEKLHMELERVHEKLKGESTKYDTTMKRLLRKLKKLFSRMNRSDCIDVLKQCQEDVDANLKILNNKLGSLEIKSDQRTSQEVQLDSKKNAGLIAEGSVGDDLGRLSGTPIASPTAPPAPNAVLETPKTSAPSNIPSGQPTSAPADIQPASVAAGKQEESSPHVNLLKGAKMTDIKSEQRTSQDVGLDSEKNAGVIAEGSGGDDSGRLPDTPIAPPTATPAPDAGSEAPKNSAASNIPADQPLSVPTGIQPASVAAEKQKESSPRANLLKIAKTTFKAAEGISGTLPVVGGYLGVVAKVGSTVVDMVQTMDDNDETGEKLVARVSKLSEVLERASNSARQPEESQTTKDVEALRQ